MSLATYKDLCLDANDATLLGRFWADVLGLDFHSEDGPDTYLTGAGPQETVWINTVPEVRTVKSRVHLEVQVSVRGELTEVGAHVIDQHDGWAVLVDPEGNEFCAVLDESITHRQLVALTIDAADPQAQATWWQQVLGGQVSNPEEGHYVVGPIPGAPFSSLSFEQVPEPKTVKNRVHIDVRTESLGALVAAGATVLCPKGADPWTVLADPEGNEFCAFTE